MYVLVENYKKDISELLILSGEMFECKLMHRKKEIKREYPFV